MSAPLLIRKNLIHHRGPPFLLSQKIVISNSLPDTSPKKISSHPSDGGGDRLATRVLAESLRVMSHDAALYLSR
jgi:hypothetical protein